MIIQIKVGDKEGGLLLVVVQGKLSFLKSKG